MKRKDRDDEAVVRKMSGLDVGQGSSATLTCGLGSQRKLLIGWYILTLQVIGYDYRKADTGLPRSLFSIGCSQAHAVRQAAELLREHALAISCRKVNILLSLTCKQKLLE